MSPELDKKYSHDQRIVYLKYRVDAAGVAEIIVKG